MFPGKDRRGVCRIFSELIIVQLLFFPGRNCEDFAAPILYDSLLYETGAQRIYWKAHTAKEMAIQTISK
jgi:hypothetical protein